MVKKRTTCDCAKQVDEKLKDDGLRLDRSLQINFATKTSGLSTPLLQMAWIGGKKPKGSKLRRMPVMTCAYCPFCGKKYPE